MHHAFVVDIEAVNRRERELALEGDHAETDRVSVVSVTSRSSCPAMTSGGHSRYRSTASVMTKWNLLPLRYRICCRCMRAPTASSTSSGAPISSTPSASR